MVRGVIDDADDFARQRLVPLGVLQGAVLARDVAVDAMLTYDDVELDETSTIVRMRRIQEAMAAGNEPPTCSQLRDAAGGRSGVSGGRTEGPARR